MPLIPPGQCLQPGCTNLAGKSGFCWMHNPTRPKPPAKLDNIRYTPVWEQNRHDVTVTCHPSAVFYERILDEAGYTLIEEIKNPDTGEIDAHIWIKHTGEGC